MRQFAQRISSEEILHQVGAKINWKCIKALIDKTRTTDEYVWYAEQCLKNGWSSAVLVHQIESGLSRNGNGIWYQVRRFGKANIAATYKGKRYVCRIRVVGPEPDEGSDNIVQDSSGVSDNEDNIPPGDDSAPVQGPSDSETPENSGTAAGSDDASGSTSGGATSIYNERIADFRSRYIMDGMSDYDKMIAICEYLTKEFDYEPYQPNFETMIETGGGDCMASRIGVFKLARLLGLKAFKCSRYEDHGRTMVRCGDQVYMTVTGFNVPQPRYYMVFRLFSAPGKHAVTVASVLSLA